MTTRRTLTFASASLATLTACAVLIATPAWSQDGDGGTERLTPLHPAVQREAQEKEEQDERLARILETQEAIAHIDQQLEEVALELARAGIDPANIHAAVASATVQLDDAKTNRMVLEARRDAVERAIAELTVRLDERIDQDDVVRALHAALDEARALLARLPEMIKNWEWDPEYHAQKAKVLDLQIALSDRRNAVAEVFGAPTMRRLQAQAIDLEIDRTELGARIEMFSARRAKLDNALHDYQSMTAGLQRERVRLRRELQILSTPRGGFG